MFISTLSCYWCSDSPHLLFSCGHFIPSPSSSSFCLLFRFYPFNDTQSKGWAAEGGQANGFQYCSSRQREVDPLVWPFYSTCKPTSIHVRVVPLRKTGSDDHDDTASNSSADTVLQMSADTDNNTMLVLWARANL